MVILTMEALAEIQPCLGEIGQDHIHLPSNSLGLYESAKYVLSSGVTMHLYHVIGLVDGPDHDLLSGTLAFLPEPAKPVASTPCIPH
jgi:hypothetical protein